MIAGPDDFGDQPQSPLFGGFSEAELVEQPAIDLFAELGWATANLFGEFAHAASAEGRASKRDAILPNRLKSALKRLNAALPQQALDDAFAELTRDRRAIDPIRANAEVHALIRNGAPVEVREKAASARPRSFASSTGRTRKPTTSSSPRRSGSQASFTQSAPTSLASSTVCRFSSPN